MRKVILFCLICSLPFMVLGCGDGQGGNGLEAQTQVGELPRYGFESDHMSLEEIGRMLERMGREIQESGSVTFAGNAYPLTGYGDIEFNLMPRPRPDGSIATGFELGVGARGTSDPPQPGREGKAYTFFEGASVQGTPTEVADAIDGLAATLESTGTFSWDIHSADFVGTAFVDQYLGQNTRNPRQPYRVMLDITFGEGEFARHDDREDLDEAVERGQGTVLGSTGAEGVDQAGVVEALQAFAAAVRSGQVAIGEGEAGVGEEVSLGFGHVAAFDGSSEKIEMVLNWPSLPPPEPEDRAAGARYYEEPWAMPITEFAEMLQRIATEILEDGTFTMEGEEYTVGETVGGEIGFQSRGMVIEVGWRR